MAARQAPAAPPAPPEPKAEQSALDQTLAKWRDPWAHVMETVTPMMDRAGMLGSKEGYLRKLGGAMVPQNTAELALTVMMALQPETALARWGVPLAEKVAAKGIVPGLARAGLRGLATAGVGAATGRSAGESGLLGAGGSIVGETLGRGAANMAQDARSNLALGNITKDLTEQFQRTIGQWLPKPKAGAADYSPERILRSVWSGEATANVSAELNRIKLAHAKTPVPVIDLEPQMTAAGVVFTPKAALSGEGPAAPWKLTPGRELAPRRAMTAERPLGEALDAIGQARTTWDKVRSDPKATAEARDSANIRLGQLRGFEDELVNRADPNYGNVLKQWARTKQLQDWLDVSAPSLFDGRTGRLSWDGYVELAQRLGKREPNAGHLPSFSPEEVSGFGTAMRLDLERGGMVWGAPGQGPIGGIGLHAGSLPYIKPQMPQPARMPGLQPGALGRLAPAAVRAITGQMPLHLSPGQLAPRSAEGAEMSDRADPQYFEERPNAQHRPSLSGLSYPITQSQLGEWLRTRNFYPSLEWISRRGYRAPPRRNE
jgi:hypothetical protein